jgi:translation initiation factor IF-3
MDFGKFRFEQNKKLKEAKKKQKNIVVKEIKFRPKIDNHDFMTKLKKVEEFLGKGCRVKVTIMFRGREMAYKEHGKIILDRVVENIGEEKIVIEQTVKTEGRNMMMTIAPKTGVEFNENIDDTDENTGIEIQDDDFSDSDFADSEFTDDE